MYPLIVFSRLSVYSRLRVDRKKIYVNDLEDQCGQNTFYAFTNVNDRKRIRVDGALDHTASCKGPHTDPSKVKAVQDLQPPKIFRTIKNISRAGWIFS